jgi:hypothetical protein
MILSVNGTQQGVNLSSEFSPFAGFAMNNLANTCLDLGMHHEALVLQEKALSLLRSVLDENDPSLGVVKEHTPSRRTHR